MSQSCFGGQQAGSQGSPMPCGVSMPSRGAFTLWPMSPARSPGLTRATSSRSLACPPNSQGLSAQQVSYLLPNPHVTKLLVPVLQEWGSSGVGYSLLSKD